MFKMAKFNCFSAFVGKKKSKAISDAPDTYKGHGTLQVKLEHLTYPSKEKVSTPTSFDVPLPFEIQGNSTFKVKVVSEEDSIRPEVVEVAYEGGDEHDEILSMRRDLSDFDLQARAVNDGVETNLSMNTNYRSYDSFNTELNGKSGREEDGSEMIQGGHVSDPGIGRREFWSSPKLMRSCSNIETRDMLKKIGNQLPPSKSHSFEDLQNLMENMKADIVRGIQTSPMSVITSCSADKVMLKRRSSSQVLPSRSRRLWWKLFLWSHRNLHKPVTAKSRPVSIKTTVNKKDGYSSDTLEPSRALATRKNKGKEVCKFELPGQFYAESKNNYRGGVSGLWPHNQWVAFCTESSPTSRVDEWVNSLEAHSFLQHDEHDTEGEIKESIDYPPSPKIAGTPGKSLHTPHHPNFSLSEDILQANNIIQSLNSFSTAAHIAGMGLKVIPNISPFASLRSVDLSSNCIVYITPGSLPKSLHTLNLSRNKIATIEGLRELTRLRVVDLSYNRISRIGHGLSNCTLIKELYLAGNKISDVEGLHRLLKLTVLDLSFNKITTAKALGQLVANYNSLLALNLLGNPIQTNMGEDQLRKAVSSLLPQLVYLNKQPIKPHRAREVAMHNVAKAALGNGGWNSHGKGSRRSGHGSSPRGRMSESVQRSKSAHRNSPSARR
ncbi:uncharacterized protein LOC131242300 isoform X2 [Magnolia sinica]|uniref:uncharacterized protein LOC131242300 isoform X2 n=1 Tax=Magnolia sinica TaxID=86752 RepID=UPI002659F71F|nr:uncharacterized protein LOC131242300 isoform X2 [Magnolia sinica]